jgi:phosphonate transport system substrate-binding protein
MRLGDIMLFRNPGLILTAIIACSVHVSSYGQSIASKSSLVIAFPKTYNRVETTKLYGAYLDHLASCAKVDLVNLRGESVLKRPDTLDLLNERELLEHLQSGKLHIAQLTAGLVPVAVDANAAVPYAARGNSSSGKIANYHLKLITRLDSGHLKPVDLVGKRVAHTTPGSNSGNLAPRAYFPALGLQPDKNYTVIYSQGHERSVMGVLHGFYDGAAVASDQFQRMVTKGEIRASSFRSLWQSEPFPVEAFMLSKQVSGDVTTRIRKCTQEYRFSKEITALLDGNDRLLPINYEKDYAPVRYVQAQLAAK